MLARLNQQILLYGLTKNAKERGPPKKSKVEHTEKTSLSHFCGLILCVLSSYEGNRHRRTTYPRLRRPQRLFRRPAIGERCGYH